MGKSITCVPGECESVPAQRKGQLIIACGKWENEAKAVKIRKRPPLTSLGHESWGRGGKIFSDLRRLEGDHKRLMEGNYSGVPMLPLMSGCTNMFEWLWLFRVDKQRKNQ